MNWAGACFISRKARAVRAPRRPHRGHRVEDAQDKTAGVDPRLVHLIQAASCFLPEGCRLIVTSGLRPGARVGGSGGISQHAGGPDGLSLAIDVQLVDATGRLLPNKTRDQASGLWREYKNLADLVFHAQRVLYPELEGRLAWGGKFTLASGEWDVMHFDLGGWRGRGRYQPPDPESVPEIILAALTLPADAAGEDDEPTIA
jgi:hypothetical protein